MTDKDPNSSEVGTAPVAFVVTHPCGDCAGQGQVGAAACAACRGTGVGRFFHGTKADLKAGDLIDCGHGANFGKLDRATTYVYFTGTLDAATWGAELALGEGRGRIYVVEPTAAFEDDPNLTNQRFPGNPSKSYRSPAPLRIVGEVLNWRGHSPEAVAAMKDGLEKLKQQGIEPID